MAPPEVLVSSERVSSWGPPSSPLTSAPVTKVLPLNEARRPSEGKSRHAWPQLVADAVTCKYLPSRDRWDENRL